MRRLWKEAPWLTAGLAVTLLIAAIFAVRLIMGALFWADPRHQDMPIAPWMTPKFVAMSWDLPREVVGQALDLPDAPKGKGPPPTLEDMADARGVPVTQLIAELQSAIAAHRASLGEGQGARDE